MTQCNRCGQCCHYFDEELNLRKCSQLIKIKNTTVCRIYKNRIGHKIDKLGKGFVRCGNRDDVKLDYPGCPYNKGNPIFNKEEVRKLREVENGNNTNNSSF